MSDRLIEVAPAVPLSATARQTYTYRLPAPLSEPLLYRSVRIALGNRRTRGFIISEITRPPPYALKTAHLLPGAALTAAQVGFAEWLHTTQRGGLGYTLRLFVPPPETVTTPKQRKRVPRPQAIMQAEAQKRWVKLAGQLQPYHKKKQPVLIIVPEKWLLEPLAAALKEKLACSPLIIHAGLKRSTLQQAVHAITKGAPIIIGTQKALFLPYPALGAVVLEEENYQTHKLWDQYPRLSNWHGVEQVAALHRAALIYTTSFPSVRLYGQFKTSRLPAGQAGLPTLPKIKVVSLSFSEHRNKHILPRSLISSLREWLKKKHVGMIHTLSPIRAKELRHTMYTTFSRSNNLMIGTPNEIATIQQSYDELVWLLPENILRYPDYRSREHAYTLLQRLGYLVPKRSALHLVTRFPRQIEQELLVTTTDYFEQELKARQRLNYPPFAEVVRLTITDRTAKQAAAAAEKVRQQLEPHGQIRGPFAALDNPKPERHLLLRGTLPEVTSLYRSARISRADLDPFRIL